MAKKSAIEMYRKLVDLGSKYQETGFTDAFQFPMDRSDLQILSSRLNFEAHNSDSFNNEIKANKRLLKEMMELYNSIRSNIDTQTLRILTKHPHAILKNQIGRAHV